MTHDNLGTGGPAGETIIRMSSEGGSITLSAARGPAGWAHFTVLIDDHPPIDLLSDEDGGPVAYSRAEGPAETWEGALDLLDHSVWQILRPDYVHPAFRQMVIAAVRKRAADKDDACAEFVDDYLPPWELACSSAEEP